MFRIRTYVGAVFSEADEKVFLSDAREPTARLVPRFLRGMRQAYSTASRVPSEFQIAW